MSNDPAIIAATGNPPAAAPAASPGTPPAAAPAAAGPDWAKGFADDIRGYVELKGFKDPASVVDAYRNLEKLQGVPKDRLLRLPEKMDDAKAMREVYTKLGMPEKAEGYEVKVPDGLSPDFANWAKSQFHELGLSKAQGDALAAKWNERVQGMLTAQATSQQDEKNQQAAKLQAEWGAAFNENKAKVTQFAEAAGISKEQEVALANALGVDGVNRLFMGIMTKFGVKLGEDTFRGDGGGNNFGNLSPAAANERKKELLSDSEWTKKYVSGDISARKEMERLERNILGMQSA